jgi:hypothetical protein
VSDDRPALTPAPDELVALVVATRSADRPIDPADLRGAITAATTAGKSWDWVLHEVTVMARTGGDPRDIRNALHPGRRTPR